MLYVATLPEIGDVAEHLPSLVEGVVMDTKAHVGIEAADVAFQQFQVLKCRAVLDDVPAQAVGLHDTPGHVAQGSVRRVRSAWLDDTADEFHAVRGGLQVELVLVQLQFEILLQPLRRPLAQVDDEAFVVGDDQRVIDEAAGR